jgi:hypothetical protein
MSDIKWPPHKADLIVTHNGHKSNYESVAEYLTFLGVDLSKEELAECERNDSVWHIQWYPSTPIGFYHTAAPTFDAALLKANEGSDE